MNAAAAYTPVEKFRPYFDKVANGESLTEEEAAGAFDAIMEGGIPEVQLAGFLVAMKARGETVDEIAGAVRAMRSRMRTVDAPPGAIDVVGTGGDAKGTYNISTATAFVLAGAGVPVAKHGNRAVSSKSGAADVLESLGVNLAASPEDATRALNEAGVAFLFAPSYHFQSAGAALQSGGRQTPACRRVRAAMGGAAGRSTPAAGRGSRLGGPWQRRAGRAVHHRRDACR
jgi:anthranilate phosphoribosyltransferase